MSKEKFLQNDPEYAKLSATIQEWADNGTHEEKLALETFFEYAARKAFGLSHDNGNIETVDKAVRDTLSYSRLEEIRLTAINFVDRLCSIVNSTMDKAFAEAEQQGMQRLEDKLQELEEYGIDDLIEAKLAAKEPEYEKLVRESFGVENNSEMHLSDLNAYMNRLKKKRERN